MPAEELMELQMPHSVMAEQSVLGSMLIDRKSTRLNSSHWS